MKVTQRSFAILLIPLVCFLAGSFKFEKHNLSRTAVEEQAATKTQGPIPGGFDDKLETPHFVLVWRTSETRAQDAQNIKTLAEDLFAGISAYVDEQHTPDKKLILVLDGDARLPNGRYRVPHVDAHGRIYVYSFPGRGHFGEAPSREAASPELSMPPLSRGEFRFIFGDHSDWRITDELWYPSLSTFLIPL